MIIEIIKFVMHDNLKNSNSVIVGYIWYITVQLNDEW